MQQQDLFGETLEKKILRMDQWMRRLQKEMFFLKEVYKLKTRQERIDTAIAYEGAQADMFVG